MILFNLSQKTTCFTFKGNVTSELNEFCKFLKGSLLPINSVDHFLSEMLHKIDALKEFPGNHPLTLEMAIAKL